jgi:hypothetical protein
MPKVHSHYENLKVSRDAPPEVIRAAYRSLSMKYHPDRNQGDPEAARVMSILNSAFATLSDPEKRRAHDRWIAQAEAAGNETPGWQQSENRPFSRDKESRRQTTASSYQAGKNFARIFDYLKKPLAIKNNQVVAHIFRYWFWYGMAVFSIISVLDKTPRTPLPGPKPYVANPIQQQAVTEYVRPAAAPNGMPWPFGSGYVTGYKRMNTRGLSTVTIDNTQNDSDVFVKLVSLDGQKAFPVRTFFILARSTFTLNQITAGSYDIRYRDLNTGMLNRSESFNLYEIRTDKGTKFSTITMTLYKVRNGNMHTYALSENEF